MKCDIVLGSLFGDEGKGVVVDNLCNGPSTLVVRFSGGQQCGHCQTGDTLIYSVDGIRYLKDMVGDRTNTDRTFRIINKNLIAENTSLLFREENCRINHILLKNGMTLKCTDNHKFLVWDKNQLSLSWVPYLKLDRDTHQFVFPKDFDSYEGRVPCLSNKERVNKNNRKYIDVANIDYEFLAEYIGLVNGDGIYHKKYIGIIFHKKQRDLLEFVHDNVLKLNLRPIVKDHSLSEKCQTLSIYSVDFIDILKDLGVYTVKGENKKTPEFVLCGTKNMQRAYIRGLFETDGCVKYHTIRKTEHVTGKVCFNNTSFFLVNELQNLLYLNGIHSSVSSEIKNDHKKQYTLTISSLKDLQQFSDTIGFRSEYNSSRLSILLGGKQIDRDYHMTGDRILINRQDKKEIYSIYRPKKQFRVCPTMSADIISSISDRLPDRYKEMLDVVRKYRLVDISKLENNISTDIVFDLTCDDTHSYISNGTISHNTVMRDGKKHVFSNFGSGTIQGSKTFFTEHTTVFPRTFLKEYEILQEKGINPPRVYIHPMARITTVFDVAFNRASENTFGRHGSCGLGVGATMKRNDETCYNLYAIDLKHLEIYKRKLGAISIYYGTLAASKSDEFVTEYRHQLSILGLEYSIYSNSLIDEEVKSFLDKVYIVDIQHPKYDLGIDNVVFEGSQGIQLDMHHGVFPNVTYANTTSKNAVEYLKKWESRFASIYYTTRCYGTRHGEGWVPNNNPVKLINNEEEINFFNEYQRNFKVFEFDQSIVEQSVEIDSIYHRDLYVSKHLVITCVDQRPEWTVPKFDTNFFKIHLNNSPKCGNMSIYGK